MGWPQQPQEWPSQHPPARLPGPRTCQASTQHLPLPDFKAMDQPSQHRARLLGRCTPAASTRGAAGLDFHFQNVQKLGTFSTFFLRACEQKIFIFFANTQGVSQPGPPRQEYGRQSATKHPLGQLKAWTAPLEGRRCGPLGLTPGGSSHAEPLWATRPSCGLGHHASLCHRLASSREAFASPHGSWAIDVLAKSWLGSMSYQQSVSLQQTGKGSYDLLHD